MYDLETVAGSYCGNRVYQVERTRPASVTRGSKIPLKPLVSYAASPSDTASRRGVRNPVQERF